MPPLSGIYCLAYLDGEAAEVIREIHQRYDPKLAAAHPPHVTLAGSSGMGPIDRGVTPEMIRRTIAPIAAEIAPLSLRFGPPERFMQTSIVSLPLNPHGPLRSLHERIKTSGLPFAAPRFAFTPHVTLSFYPELTRERARELLALRVEAPAIIGRLVFALSRDPQPAKRLVELTLGEAATGGHGHRDD